MNTKPKPWEIVTEVMKLLCENAKPGVNTLALTNIAEAKMREYGAVPANKNYFPKWALQPFPQAVCINVNEEIAHGIPNKKKILQDGDLVNFDFGVKIGGLAGDAAMTIPVGKLSDRDDRLLRIAKRALYAGIDIVKPGVKLGEISEAIQKVAWKEHMAVNRTFSGHFIGKEMHEDPLILNYVLPGYAPNNVELREGWTFCLEPMITWEDEIGRRTGNTWTWVTRDGRRTAMFEHMIRVTHDGYEILTKHFELGT
jgi:methionyl aminopeptidase